MPVISSPQPDEMVWTAAHIKFPTDDASTSSVVSGNKELQRDLAFINEDSAYNSSVEGSESNYSLPSSYLGEGVGWDGLLNDEVPHNPPTDDLPPGPEHPGKRTTKGNLDWWPFKAKEVGQCSLKIACQC